MRSVWLDFKISDSLVTRLNGKKIRVVGRVDMSDHGHDMGYIATLHDVFCLVDGCCWMLFFRKKFMEVRDRFNSLVKIFEVELLIW